MGMVGCAGSASPASSAPVNPSAIWTNWQIQAGSQITSPPNTFPAFQGAIQIQGSTASGIFTNVESTGSGAGLDYAGTVNSSNGVSLATDGFEFSYTQPSIPNSVIPVAVTGGCIYASGYTGPECTAIFSSPSVGVEVAPLNGTYTGTLTDAGTPGLSGPGTLTLTQSSTPNSSGAFPLTATLIFPAASSLGTFNLTGTVGGEAVALNECSPAVSGPCIAVAGSANPAATQVTVSINYGSAATPASSTFTGTLTLQ
jgi:hypothetical protein